MRIAIIGGGNIGTLMAAEFAFRGNEVTIYTRREAEWSKHIAVYGKTLDVMMEADVSNITGNLQEAVMDADYIWITTPATSFSCLAGRLLPLVKAGQKIGVVPGSGGAEFAFHKLLSKGCILFGLQRVHSIARLERYGHSVHMLGRKPELVIGAIPSEKTQEIANECEQLFELPCIVLPNYLSVTLTPSNPILHTTRLYSMFRDYQKGMTYPRNFLFYEEWNDASSELLIACDEELQEVCRVIPLDLSGVKSLRDHYESHSIEAMTKKISGIAAFKGLASPMKKVDSGTKTYWIPDFTSRYFTADFSYGIKVLIDLADAYQVPVPHMKQVWEWYMPLKEEPDYFQIGIGREEIEQLYASGYKL